MSDSYAVPPLKCILFVIGSLEIGGAERHLFNVAIRLKERGYEPEVFTFKLGGPLAGAFEQHRIPIHGIQPPALLNRIIHSPRIRAWIGLGFSSLALLKTYWMRRPSVAHFFLPAAYVVGGLISMFAPVRARIMSRRSLNFYQANYSHFDKVEYWLHPRMNFVCGNSKAVTAQLQEEGVPQDRLRLIYNGIDLAPFDVPFDRLKARKQLGISADDIVFVMVANLIPYKGHSDLLKAFALIQKELPKCWRLLCLGRDDGIGASLLSEAESLGIADHISFMGSRPDVPDFLRLADVGILSSHEEGFSNAVLEYMAASLPVVATDVGGNAEAILDDVTGYVVPASRPHELGSALFRLAMNLDRKAMGQRGRQRVAETFSMAACVDAYEALYREAGVTAR